MGNMMPLPSCDAGHDYSEPYTERLKGANNVTIVRLVKSCLGCGKVVEVTAPAPKLPLSERIKSYDL